MADHNGSEIAQWTGALIRHVDNVEAATDVSVRGLWLRSTFLLTGSEAERAAAIVRHVLTDRA